MIRKTRKDLSYNLNPNIDLRNSELFQASPIEVLYNDTINVPNGQKAFHRSNDVTLLFNQERISKTVGVDTLNNWLAALMPKSDSLRELKSKCTDEELMQICKSRYIQKPSELLAWSDYLNSNFESIMKQVKSDNTDNTSLETGPVDNDEDISSPASASASSD